MDTGDNTTSGKVQPGLTVILKREAGIHATLKGLSSGSSDITPLQAVLDEHGAKLELLFGHNEERLRRKTEKLVAQDPTLPDLSTYYVVHASPSEFEELAKKLLALDVVDGAYVTPPATDPLFFKPQIPMQVLEDPATTPNFISHQDSLQAS